MHNHPTNLEASILHRLRNYARKTNADPKLIHLWYGIERFLYRLSLYEFDGRTLSKSIGATFFQRGTSVPSEIPLGLGHTFATDPSHQQQWDAFLNREIRDLNQHPKLEDILDELVSFLMPAAAMSSVSDTFLYRWCFETGWQSISGPPLDKPG